MGASHSHVCRALNVLIADVVNENMERYGERLSTVSKKRKRMIRRRVYRIVRSRIPHELIQYYCDSISRDAELARIHMANLRSVVAYAFQRIMISLSDVGGRTGHLSSSTPCTTSENPPVPTGAESDLEADAVYPPATVTKIADENVDIHGIRLSVFSMTTTVKSLQLDKLPTCPICLVDYEEGDTIITLPCFHIYHKHCVRPWLHSGDGCAMCRLTPLDLLRNADKIINNEHIDVGSKETPQGSEALVIR